MATRRVVTGNDAQGRSVIVSDGPASGAALEELWVSSGDDPLGRDPAGEEPTLLPPPGGARWRLVELRPGGALRERYRHEAGPTATGIGEDGWHVTNTIDYVMVLDGELTLLVDDGSVDLGPGDCVVQRATNHAWRNRGDAPARIVALMVSLDQAGPRT